MRRLKEELHKDVVCHRFCSTYTANTVAAKLLNGFGDLKIGGQVIRTEIRNDLVLLAKEETLLQDMSERLIQTGKRFGKEMNVGEKN